MPPRVAPGQYELVRAILRSETVHEMEVSERRRVDLYSATGWITVKAPPERSDSNGEVLPEQRGREALVPS